MSALVSTARLIVDRVWTPWRWLTILTLVMTAIWMFRRRMLLTWLIPTAALSAFFWLVYGEDRHVGILYLVWLTCLWMSFDASTPASRPMPPRERRAVALLLTGIIVSQWSWTIQTTTFDWRHNYGGSRDVYVYLKEHGLESKRICAVGFHCSAILPYFDRNVFVNWNHGQPPSGWWWSTKFHYFDTPDEIVRANPDVIIRTLKPPLWRANVEAPGYAGYRKVAEATGAIFLHDRIKEDDSFQIWIRNE